MVPFPYSGIIIAGPTACGKSGLALELAQRLSCYQPAHIINADSMQVYRELSILTARPTLRDCATTPHHLYGIIDGTQRCSAGWWREQAEEKIQHCYHHSIFPIIVGGTGLYLQALTQGLSPMPPIDPEIKQKADSLLQSYNGDFYDYVCQQDPLVKNRLQPHDHQRLKRALEVFLQTNKSIFLWHSQTLPGITSFLFCIITPERNQLYQHINQRFLTMIEQGALEEVASLKAASLPADSPLLKAIGVQELFGFLEGTYNLETAIQMAQLNSRRYAKRQMTWFRHQVDKKIVLDSPNLDTLWTHLLAN